jgi:hypothetical protein
VRKGIEIGIASPHLAVHGHKLLAVDLVVDLGHHLGREHMVGEDGCELRLVLGKQQVVQRAGRQRGEGLVRRREEGERSRALEFGRRSELGVRFVHVWPAVAATKEAGSQSESRQRAGIAIPPRPTPLRWTMIYQEIDNNWMSNDMIHSIATILQGATMGLYLECVHEVRGADCGDESRERARAQPRDADGRTQRVDDVHIGRDGADARGAAASRHAGYAHGRRRERRGARERREHDEACGAPAVGWRGGGSGAVARARRGRDRACESRSDVRHRDSTSQINFKTSLIAVSSEAPRLPHNIA